MLGRPPAVSGDSSIALQASGEMLDLLMCSGEICNVAGSSDDYCAVEGPALPTFAIKLPYKRMASGGRPSAISLDVSRPLPLADRGGGCREVWVPRYVPPKEAVVPRVDMLLATCPPPPPLTILGCGSGRAG